MKREQIILVVSLFIVLAACLSSSSVQAQTVNTYTSLASWQAAVAGRQQFSVNFQNITKDTYFQTSAVNVGPFSLQQIGQDPNFGRFQNFVDVPPLQFADNDGNTNAALYTKFGVTTVDLVFSTPVFAWGANFFGAETSELEDLVLTNTAGVVVATVPVTVDTGFFGFAISPPQGISKITFTSRISNPVPSVGQGFGLESVVGAYLVTFDTCIKDNTTGNLFQFDSKSGSYQFTVCKTGFKLTGTGVVRLVGGILTLTDSKPDRRISAGFNPGPRTGSATIVVVVSQGVSQTFTINDTNPSAVCSCPM